MTVEMIKLPDAPPFWRIAFFGRMCSGKSYMAKYLRDNHKYVRAGFADKLKAIAEDLFWLNGGKDGNDRKLLQEFSDDIKKWDPDIFIKHFLLSAEWLANVPIVCDDLRYVREAEVLRENGFTLIRVIADEKVREDRIKNLYPNTLSTAHVHKSEIESDLISADYEIFSDIPEDTRQLEGILWG